jgi:hypothetical protein
MDFADFEATLRQDEPPASWSPALQGLWWDAKGDWRQAHDCAQADESPAGAWVHAYLHRVEGDLENARYWYRQAGRRPSSAAVAEERREIVTAIPAPC